MDLKVNREELFVDTIKDIHLSIKSTASYPGDHPICREAISKSYESLANLLKKQTIVTIGVNGNRLVVDDVAIHSKHTSSTKFAMDLDQRRIDSITFYRGLSQKDFTTFLNAMIKRPNVLMQEGGLVFNRITMVPSPDGTNGVRQFRPPRFLSVFFILLFIPCAALLTSEIAVGKQDRTELHIRLASTPSILPTRGRLSSPFGYRNSPFRREKEFHKGIDIATRMNTPVVAPAKGFVSSIRWEHMPGKVLYINHGHGLVTKYAHLRKALVQKGQLVKRGEKVALVGNTGRSTAPHLHYEVYLNGVPTNPLRYVSRDALSLLTDRPTKEPATNILAPRSLQDEETNLEVLMRVDKNKEGRRVLFDLDKNEWQFQLPRWATVGSLVIVDLVIKNKKVIKGHPIRNLGYVDSPTLSP